MTSDDLWPWYDFNHMNIQRSHNVSINQVKFQSDFNFSNEVNFTFWAHLTTWPRMTFDLGVLPYTTWAYKRSHNVSINQVRFQSDFNFSNEVNFTFWPHLTTWPLMTFDLSIWPLTTWTYKGSHNLSINQAWFQSDFNFSNEAAFIFSAYLTTWPEITFDLDMNFDLFNQWGLPRCIHGPTLDEIHCGWNPSKHVELEPNVNLFSQTTTD